MNRFIFVVDSFSAWVGKAFAWCILLLTFGTAYEVFVRYVLRDPTSWAFDISYMMYGTLFMMGGAYTLSRDGHVRGDVLGGRVGHHQGIGVGGGAVRVAGVAEQVGRTPEKLDAGSLLEGPGLGHDLRQVPVGRPDVGAYVGSVVGTSCPVSLK